jgi:hypothetical protein
MGMSREALGFDWAMFMPAVGTLEEPGGGGIPPTIPGFGTPSWVPEGLKPTCPDDKKDFYGNWGIYKEMADNLNTDVGFILALSALETGYLSSNAALNGHNLFGASDANENPLSYSSYQASADAWVDRWGNDVRGVRDATKFFQNLVNDRYNPHPGYVDNLVKQVGYTRAYTNECIPDDWR